MAIAKVILNGTTQIDLTQDTVQASNTVSSATGHKNDGTTFTGSITRRGTIDLTASGDTVTVPSGYYEARATKAVASGSEGTPTATKGTVSGNSVSVTPSVTNTEGYISGGTKTGTAVTVSASELVSGTYSVTSSGTKDVTNYASASVPSGSATPASSISATGSTVSTGTNTLTLSKSVSNTPQVSAGYVSSGTAGNSNVSLTATVTTKAAATITPTTTAQTIASGTYLTGAQTISGDANLIAGNIKKDVSIFGVTGTLDGGAGNFTLLATLDMGTISTSSTTATNTNKSLSVSGVNAYDLLIVETSVNTPTNGRHLATVGLINLTASSAIGTKNGGTIATTKLQFRQSSSGTVTSAQATTAYGIYPNSITISNGTASIPMYQRYNQTSTTTINGTYTARCYGVKLYDFIGG